MNIRNDNINIRLLRVELRIPYQHNSQFKLPMWYIYSMTRLDGGKCLEWALAWKKKRALSQTPSVQAEINIPRAFSAYASH